ncbi:MAG TPA: MFS transporter [Planctomicrobium sp.]|nr:MFS transporter [Planctomicrobium sp.]
MADLKKGDEESSLSIYNQAFWLAFVANLLLVTANTLTYRFAEFIRFLGSTEEVTGRIIAAGLVGSLVWRLFLGQAMDRFGIRKVWAVSTLMYLAGGTMMALSTSVGPLLWCARVSFAIGLASMFTTALAHIQSLAPPNRRTEIIASYGAAGFLGLILGAQLGDLLFYFHPDGAVLYPILFTLTTLLGIGHGVLGAVLTRNLAHKKPTATPGLRKLFVKYWPGRLLVVSAVMGLVLTVTTIFLTRYATEQNVGGLRLFFSTYAITAFLMRLSTRCWNRFGRHQLIVCGMVSHAVGCLLLLLVTTSWHFIPPAICFGFGHALLFPCLVSLGAGAFPDRYRGTGTTLCLASIDLGTMATAPIVGWGIDHYGFYPMLVISGLIMGSAAIYYAVATWSVVDEEKRVKPAQRVIPPGKIKEVPALSLAAAIRPSRREIRQSQATTKAG